LIENIFALSRRVTWKREKQQSTSFKPLSSTRHCTDIVAWNKLSLKFRTIKHYKEI
jgi:hypothetical protein